MKDHETKEQSANELSQCITEVVELRHKLAEIEESGKKVKETEERLRKGIIEYEKLAALGRLTANVAHEIRNPITVIGGLVERLKKCISFGVSEKEYLDMISLEAKRLEEILRDVLTFSNKTFLHREKHDTSTINKAIDESLAACGDICKARSISVQKICRDVPEAYIDRKYLKEALNDLLSNAVDAMPGGGTLTVAANKTSAGGRTYVTITVTDTGAGIPEDKLGLIFEPFFTTKGAKTETGLGLPIARKMVEAHGGFIRVESAAGKGSSFTLYFPYRVK